MIHGLAMTACIKVDGMDLISACGNHELIHRSPTSIRTNVGSAEVFAGITPVSVGG